MRALLLIWFVAVAAPALPASGWSAPAHEVLCEIAWRRLSPAGRRLVGELRRHDKQPGQTFAGSCVWADRVRHRGGSHSHTAPYHYLNVPEGVAGVDEARDCPPRRRCVTWAIRHYAEKLANPRLTRSERADALKFLAHFVGDVHQPLHVGRAADRGGNEIAVDFLGDFGSCGRGKQRTLHQVWDRSLLARAKLRWPESAHRLDAMVTGEQVRAWTATDPVAWADESYRWNESFVYRLDAPVVRCGVRKFHPISAAYADRATAIAQERLQQAGVRLAFMINRIAEKSAGGAADGSGAR